MRERPVERKDAFHGPFVSLFRDAQSGRNERMGLVEYLQSVERVMPCTLVFNDFTYGIPFGGRHA